MKRGAAWLAGVIVGGCAGARVADERPLAGWSGPPPRVTVQLAGSGADADGQRRCDEALARAGAVVDANASAQPVVTMDGRRNRLQVLTTRRGLVRNEERPAWPVERLCEDALAALAQALADDTTSPGVPSMAADATATPYSALPQQSRSPASGGVYVSPIQ
jgi:hypothetical protein